MSPEEYRQKRAEYNKLCKYCSKEVVNGTCGCAPQVREFMDSKLTELIEKNRAKVFAFRAGYLSALKRLHPDACVDELAYLYRTVDVDMNTWLLERL